MGEDPLGRTEQSAAVKVMSRFSANPSPLLKGFQVLVIDVCTIKVVLRHKVRKILSSRRGINTSRRGRLGGPECRYNEVNSCSIVDTFDAAALVCSQLSPP